MKCVLESGPLVPECLRPNILVTPRSRVKLHHELAVVDGGLALQGRESACACVRDQMAVRTPFPYLDPGGMKCSSHKVHT